jgi:hypothetical protein
MRPLKRIVFCPGVTVWRIDPMRLYAVQRRFRSRRR